MANFCKKYDEVTTPDSEVRCVGYEPTATCGECCFASKKLRTFDANHIWCKFFMTEKDAGDAACEAWEPVVEL